MAARGSPRSTAEAGDHQAACTRRTPLRRWRRAWHDEPVALMYLRADKSGLRGVTRRTQRQRLHYSRCKNVARFSLMPPFVRAGAALTERTRHRPCCRRTASAHRVLGIGHVPPCRGQQCHVAVRLSVPICGALRLFGKNNQYDQLWGVSLSDYVIKEHVTWRTSRAAGVRRAEPAVGGDGARMPETARPSCSVRRDGAGGDVVGQAGVVGQSAQAVAAATSAAPPV